MPLNLGIGNSTPFVKYNSKADKWLVAGDKEIDRPVFVADLDNIAIGWLLYREGQAPQRCIFPSLDCEAPKPNEDFKKGFILTLFSERFFDGAVEFSSTSLNVRSAVSELYNTWEAQRAQHPGELPVVACFGSGSRHRTGRIARFAARTGNTVMRRRLRAARRAIGATA